MPNLAEALTIKQSIPLIHSQDLFKIGNFAISNSMTTNVLTTSILLVLALAIAVKSKNKNSVSKLVVFFEIIYEMLYVFTNKITNNEHVTKAIIYLVNALFLYLLIANTVTSAPPFSFLTLGDKTLFRGQTSDFSTTFGLATCLIILANYKGLKSHGILEYINEYIPFYDLVNNIRNKPKHIGSHIFSFILGFFMGILDMIGEVGKTLSVSLRLFGNMYAGQILLVVAMGLFSLVLPAFLILFNIFSGLLQALIFTALISVYFTTHHKV